MVVWYWFNGHVIVTASERTNERANERTLLRKYDANHTIIRSANKTVNLLIKLYELHP